MVHGKEVWIPGGLYGVIIKQWFYHVYKDLTISVSIFLFQIPFPLFPPCNCGLAGRLVDRLKFGSVAVCVFFTVKWSNAR